MRFVVDESTGFAVAHFLQNDGHDVIVIAELMPQADDFDILEYACREERIVVTNDKDFGELIFRSGRPYYGVILLRLQDERTQNRLRVMDLLLEQYVEHLPNHFTVVTDQNVRFRPKLSADVT